MEPQYAVQSCRTGAAGGHLYESNMGRVSGARLEAALVISDDVSAHLFAGFDTDRPDSWRMYAEDVASRVNGVVDVKNRIDIRPPRLWESDWYIQEEIERTLYWDALVDGSDISVEVENRVATLKGEVDTRQELARVIRASLDAGAEYVESRIFVRSAPEEYIDQHFGRYYYPIQYE